uniref:Uncharacterized protein n=1 Tax=Globodera rostochiensis TaxID=31243 RepID=A0A914I2A7_GLORO
MRRSRSRSKSAPKIDHSKIEVFKPDAPKNSQTRFKEAKRVFQNKRQRDPLPVHVDDDQQILDVIPPHYFQHDDVDVGADEGTSTNRHQLQVPVELRHVIVIDSEDDDDFAAVHEQRKTEHFTPRKAQQRHVQHGLCGQGLPFTQRPVDPRRQPNDPRRHQDGQVQATRRPSDPRTPMGNRIGQVQVGPFGQAMPPSGQTTYPRSSMRQRQNEHEQGGASSSQRPRDPERPMEQTPQRQLSSTFQCGYSTGWASVPPTNRTPYAGQNMSRAFCQTTRQPSDPRTPMGNPIGQVQTSSTLATQTQQQNHQRMSRPTMRGQQSPGRVIVIDSEDEEPAMKRLERNELDNVPGSSFSTAPLANFATATGLGTVPAATAPHWVDAQIALAKDIQQHFVLIEHKMKKCAEIFAQEHKMSFHYVGSASCGSDSSRNHLMRLDPHMIDSNFGTKAGNPVSKISGFNREKAPSCYLDVRSIQRAWLTIFTRIIDESYMINPIACHNCQKG